MRFVGRAFRKVAGVDNSLIEDCPRFDRTWATQIGVQLVLTLLFVFFTVYLSIDYINASSVSIDPETGGLELATNVRPPWLIAAGIAAALLVAGSIFMFDRAIFQSDWFYQLPFKGPVGSQIEGSAKAWDTVWFHVRKVWRVVIRLAVSVAVGYALSTFLELRIFESLIVSEMQRAHVGENSAAYAELAADVKAINDDIDAQKSAIAGMQDEERTLVATLAVPESAAFQQADVRLDELAARTDDRFGLIDQQEQAALADPFERRAAEREKIAASDGVLKALKTKIEAEIAGNPENLENITGIPSCGPACAYYQAQYDDELGRRTAATEEVAQIEGEIADIRENFDSRRAAVQAEADEEREMVTEQRTTVASDLALQRDTVLEQKQTALDNIRDALATATAALQLAIDSRDRRIAALQENLSKSPTFIQFRDGPLDRLRAFSDLRHDPKYGASVSWFGLVAMLFIMFMEVVPVATKLFFSPPSVYAIKLQANVIREAEAAREGTAEAALQHDIDMENRRMELHRLRALREQADALSSSTVTILRKG